MTVHKVTILVKAPGLAPHPLDDRIMELYRELKSLVYKRKCDRIGASHRGRTHTQEHCDKVSRAKTGVPRKARA